MDHVSWSLETIFKNHLLDVCLTQNQETMTLWTLSCWFILNYYVWGPAWIEMIGNSIWLRVCDHTTWVWRCVGTAFGHFLLGSHNLMVTALGLCVNATLCFTATEYPPLAQRSISVWHMTPCMKVQLSYRKFGRIISVLNPKPF